MGQRTSVVSNVPTPQLPYPGRLGGGPWVVETRLWVVGGGGVAEVVGAAERTLPSVRVTQNLPVLLLAAASAERGTRVCGLCVCVLSV